MTKRTPKAAAAAAPAPAVANPPATAVATLPATTVQAIVQPAAAAAAPRKSLRGKAKESAEALKDSLKGKSLAAFAAAARADAAAPPATGSKAGTTKAGTATPAKAGEKAAKAVKEKAPAAPPVEFVPRQYVKGQPIFALDERHRPSNGGMLLAHTHAALTVLGLLNPARPALRKNQLLTMIGQRAVNYHLGNGNFEDAPDQCLRLSILGLNTFGNRMKDGKVDKAAAMAFQSAFLDGAANQKFGIAADSLYKNVFN